jgi:DNA-binding LacI/PurR family transcriptional regulator
MQNITLRKDKEIKTVKPILTQMELAKMLGISYATVNRALNGDDRVDEETRYHIKEMANRLGYHRNMVASSLVRRRTNMIGLVLCGTQNSFFGQIAGEIQAVAKDRNYHVLLADTRVDLDVETEALKSLLEIQAAGVLIQPAAGRKDFEVIHQLNRSNVPILTLSTRAEAVSRNFIGTDCEMGSIEAVNYLVKLGHRRIVHLPGALEESPAQDRLRGYELALKANGITMDPRWVIDGEPSSFAAESVPARMEKWMKLDPRPTAIFAATDGMAMVAINWLLARGFRVPQDVSVMGYANMPECIYSAVPLTTMDQHPQQMGRRAVEMLIDLIEGRGQPASVEVLKDTLVERASCAHFQS